MKKLSIFTLIIPIALSGALHGALYAADASETPEIREFRLQQEAKAKSAEQNFKAGLLVPSDDENSTVVTTPSNHDDDKQLAADIALVQDLCERNCGLPIAQYLTDGWQLERTLSDHTNHTFLRMCEVNDKEYLMSASRDGKLRVWDPVSGAGLYWLDIAGGSIQSFDAVSYGNVIYLAAALHNSKKVILGKIIGITTPQSGFLMAWQDCPLHKNAIHEIVISRKTDSDTLIALSRSQPDNEIYEWDFTDLGLALNNIPVAEDGVELMPGTSPMLRPRTRHACHCLNCHNFITGTCHKRELTIKNKKSNTTFVCTGHRGPIKILENLSTNSASKAQPGMNKFITGSTDHTIKIWDKRTGACDQTLHGHDKAITDIQTIFLDKNQRQALIASASKDGRICIWRYCRPADLVALFKNKPRTESIAKPESDADYDLADCSLFKE